MDTRDGVQKLHAEIDSDDDFDKFLEREGLLVMDVYTEWCGPCISMTSSLEKLKLELGGDKLHLAKCKSDKIQRLEKFRNTSKPTWLLASNRIVKCLSGANMPVLLETIAEELALEENYESRHHNRKAFDWKTLPSTRKITDNKQNAKPDAAITLSMADYTKTLEIVEDLADRGDTREC